MTRITRMEAAQREPAIQARFSVMAGLIEREGPVCNSVHLLRVLRGVKRLVVAGWSCLLASMTIEAATVPPSWDLPPSQQTNGVFWQEHWYERERVEGRTRRLRINSPETSLGRFANRVEARENGLMLIDAGEDLSQITAAELYAELWGGHPGTANKRVAINGRSTYDLPRVGTEDGHCTFSYPVVKLDISDLVSGLNAIQWTVEQGTTFWGHAMVDQACLRLALTNGHPRLIKHDLADFSARVVARPYETATDEGINLVLELDDRWRSRIESVSFEGWYSGHDENGDLRRRDWHGFTLDRQPVAHLGTAPAGSIALNWDTRLLPAQKNVAVRAIVRFKDLSGLVYLTSATPDLVIPDRDRAVVHLYEPADVPVPFWSRAGNRRTCTVVLDIAPERIEEVELYVTTWTGGAGGVTDYFTINGVHHPVAEGSAHTRQFNRLRLDPRILRQGANVIELLSDTEHHGIEVVHPGPTLLIRHRR